MRAQGWRTTPGDVVHFDHLASPRRAGMTCTPSSGYGTAITRTSDSAEDGAPTARTAARLPRPGERLAVGACK